MFYKLSAFHRLKALSENRSVHLNARSSWCNDYNDCCKFLEGMPRVLSLRPLQACALTSTRWWDDSTAPLRQLVPSTLSRMSSNVPDYLPFPHADCHHLCWTSIDPDTWYVSSLLSTCLTLVKYSSLCVVSAQDVLLCRRLRIFQDNHKQVEC